MDRTAFQRQLSLPGYPRDLALIPSYSFIREPLAEPETRDLLAVVGGKVSPSADGFGNLTGSQYLWVIDISQAGAPSPAATSIVTLSPSELVSKVAWSPPDLAYLESDADDQRVGVVNLQTFIYGQHLDAEQLAAMPFFPPANDEDALALIGLDADGDGDYVDEGEQIPLPPRPTGGFVGLGYPGKVHAYAAQGSPQPIVDFAHDGAKGYVGTLLGPGASFEPDGTLIETFDASYRTLAYLEFTPYVPPATPLVAEEATFELPGLQLKRLFTVFDELLTIGDTPRLVNLALITALPNKLIVLDITLPESPHHVGDEDATTYDEARVITIEGALGNVQSISRGPDGLLRLATATDVVLLDLEQIAVPPQPDVPHPAIVGVIPGAGSGNRTLSVVPAGLSAVALLGQNAITQTAPTLEFVAFPGVGALVSPETLVGDEPAIEAALSAMVNLTNLGPARFREVESVVESTLSPPDPAVHYHVLLRAPGSAADPEGRVTLALETLDRAGRAVTSRGIGFPPVHSLAPATVAAGRTRMQEKLTPTSCPRRARRIRSGRDLRRSPPLERQARPERARRARAGPLPAQLPAPRGAGDGARRRLRHRAECGPSRPGGVRRDGRRHLGRGAPRGGPPRCRRGPAHLDGAARPPGGRSAVRPLRPRGGHLLPGA